ncbi:MFS-type transporter slc18b1, partial [Plakobranchus ocellatus]
FLDQGPNGASFVAMALLIRAVEALGMASFVTASCAIVSNEFPNHISSAFSVLETSLGVGLLIGPTLGGALYEEAECGIRTHDRTVLANLRVGSLSTVPPTPQNFEDVYKT